MISKKNPCQHRAKRPYRYANSLPPQIEAMIVASKKEKPSWGARKLRERLLRKLPHGIKVPACSTIHAILDRHGLVTRMRRSRTRAEGTTLSEGGSPNALWCTDFKGEFMFGNKQYCHPLTVTDHASRYLLMCEALKSVREVTAFTAYERHQHQHLSVGQAVGIKEVDDGIWLISFMGYDLRYVDLEEKAPQRLENPIGPAGVKHVSGTLRKRSVWFIHNPEWLAREDNDWHLFLNHKFQ